MASCCPWGVHIVPEAAGCWVCCQQACYALLACVHLAPVCQLKACLIVISLPHYFLPMSLQWQVTRENYHRLLKQITLTGMRNGNEINHTYS